MEDWTQGELRRLGRAVRSHRKALALSQEDFAEMANIHRTYVTQIEFGRANISWENISRCARALKMKPSALIASAGL